ncbi:MAG: hypothetical protein A2277_19385 [Desulfobacterales bacterium RIFOXYA12_FULL_46_15]|nr:MAG: hypothetical protein A2277_19385 [Desulfobacterales bacterium RIFOXYA12_FULL_46_15]
MTCPACAVQSWVAKKNRIRILTQCSLTDINPCSDSVADLRLLATNLFDRPFDVDYYSYKNHIIEV